MTAIRDLDLLLATLQPELKPGRFAFVLLPPGRAIEGDEILASIREPEGLSVVVPEPTAQRLGLHVAFSAAWITLTVHSALDAVGLTAAFARALGEAGISCNVVAGVHHDHLFVPFERAADAMGALRALQQRAAGTAASDVVRHGTPPAGAGR